MDPNTTTALIAAAATIIVALIELRASRDRMRVKQDREQAEVRAERREEESRLSMDLMLATSEMTDVLCLALQGGQINGNVEKARQKGEDAREAYRAFLRNQAAHQVAKI